MSKNIWNGYTAEANLIYLLKQKNYEVKLSTLTVDRMNHIDFFFRKENGLTWYSCDVKTTNRPDSYCLTAKTYNGSFGCFDSLSLNYFAFERENEFVIVSREAIHDLICNKMNEHRDMTVYSISKFAGPYKYHKNDVNSGEELFVIIRYEDFKDKVVARFTKNDYQFKCVER